MANLTETIAASLWLDAFGPGTRIGWDLAVEQAEKRGEDSAAAEQVARFRKRAQSIADTVMAVLPSVRDGEEVGSLERVRHLKRGTEYEVLARGVRLQGDAHEPDMLVFYRGADGQLWAREEGEFDDGRFEQIDVAVITPAREKPPFRTGDSILHKPSGETWVCAWADPETGYLSWLGWPPDGQALIADCELVRAVADEEHREVLRHLKGSGRRDVAKALRLYGDPDADNAAGAGE